MIFMLSRYIYFFLVISLTSAYQSTSKNKFNTFKLATKKEKDSFLFLPKLLIKALPLLISTPILYENNFVQSIQVAIADDNVPINYDKIAPWNDKIKYSIIKKGNGPQIKLGDLVEVRFKGSYKGSVFDDTFSTAEPYYYRAGVGSILKGIDDTVLQMKVGDRWLVSFGGTDLSFPSGVKSSPGKPRIPPGAELDYEIEVVNLPGAGDDFIGDYE